MRDIIRHGYNTDINQPNAEPFTTCTATHINYTTGTDNFVTLILRSIELTLKFVGETGKIAFPNMKCWKFTKNKNNSILVRSRPLNLNRLRFNKMPVSEE